MSRILRVVCVIVIVAMTYAHFSDALAICTIDYQCFDETYDPAANPPIPPAQIVEVNNRLFGMLEEIIVDGEYIQASIIMPQIGDLYMTDMQRVMAMNTWGDVSYPRRQYETYFEPFPIPMRVSVSTNIARHLRVEFGPYTWRIESVDPTHRISVAGTFTDHLDQISSFAQTLEPGQSAVFEENNILVSSGMITLSHIHIPPLMAENCFSHPDCFFYLPYAVGAFASTRGADIELRREVRQFMIESQQWGTYIIMEQIDETVDLLHNMTDVRREMIPSLRNRIDPCFVDLPGQSH